MAKSVLGFEAYAAGTRGRFGGSSGGVSRGEDFRGSGICTGRYGGSGILLAERGLSQRRLVVITRHISEERGDASATRELVRLASSVLNERV